MQKTGELDPKQFRRITARNTMLPLGLAILLSAVFITIIIHLINTNRWVNHTNQVIGQAHELYQLTIDAETGLRGFVITNRRSFLEPYDRANAVFNGKFDALKELVSDNPVQVDRLERIRTMRDTWGQYALGVISEELTPQQRTDVVLTEKGKNQMDAIRSQYNDLIRDEEHLRDERALATQESVKFTLTIILVLSLLTGAYIAFFTRKQLNAVSSIYTGALAKQAEQNESLEKVAWIQNAQVELADRARGELETAAISAEILNLVCHYIDAKAGTLYLADGTERLSLAASYGLSEEENKLRKSIALNSTLAGQVARDQKIKVLDPAPRDHLQITTTLGSSAPLSLVIAPAVANRSTKAVLEVALLRTVTPRDLELFETLSENIGIAIISAQYRSRLKDLLAESQRQAEELQVQQEELKVSNEELEEQAEALKESQSRLESQQSELEQTNLQLSDQASMLEARNDDLNRTRDSLEQKAQELSRASQYKSQFLANMSHELRTPLNSTLILTQLLIDNRNNTLTEEEIDYAKTILSASNDLLTLINDILDLAKVESGTLELHPEDITLEDIARSIDRAFKPMAQEKGITFQISVENGAPREIYADKQRLNQILKNLLSNAIKFTLKGEVRLKIAAHSPTHTRFEVSDTGIGIPENQQKVIFEAFKQADGTTSRQFGGTGLGLSISRELSDLLGAEIKVKSQSNVGSIFTLIMPNNFGENGPGKTGQAASFVSNERAQKSVPAAEAQPIKRRPRTIGPKVSDDRANLRAGMRVLMIVEDEAAFAKILYDLCHEQKFQAIVAQNAEEAVDLAVEYLPQAIILDMHLPDHSGLFVLDRLKDNPVTRHIPVHVISAEDHSTAPLQMGAIGYLMKPVDSKKITEVIQNLESRLSQNFKKVLIVEDNAVQRDAMKRLIAFPGVEVISAQTGAEALKLLQEQSFDCFVLDLTLPDISGYEVLERMNQFERSSCPPVIIYTAKSLTREEEERLQRYSQSIILKGAKSPERLLSEVSLFLHQVEAQMPKDRQKILQQLRDREKTLEGRTVLLVDDDVRNIFALNSALQPRGARTEIARNGKEALAKLAANPAIDLVLMDLMMPEMDGYEAMRQIRKDPKFQKLPIIAVTAKAMSDDQEKCIEAGASDYLAKPIDLSKLLSLIKIWLRAPGGSA